MRQYHLDSRVQSLALQSQLEMERRRSALEGDPITRWARESRESDRWERAADLEDELADILCER